MGPLSLRSGPLNYGKYLGGTWGTIRSCCPLSNLVLHVPVSMRERLGIFIPLFFFFVVFLPNFVNF